MNKIKSFLFWTVHTKLGWLLISFLWMGLFLILNDNVESIWPFLVATPAMVYIAGLFVVMMVYAFIINPIREHRETKKLLENINK